MQDANFNVIGIINESGRQVERYEYTPYGERIIYGCPTVLTDLQEATTWFNDAMLTYPQLTSARFVSTTPVSLCDFGFQGKQHDANGNMSYVYRMYSPVLMRMMQPDPGPESKFMSGPTQATDRKSGAVPTPLRVGKTGLGGQYTDGMSRYQFIRSNPVTGLDPDGLSSRVKKWIVAPRTKKRLFFEADYCCDKDLDALELAIKDAYDTLSDVNDVIYNYTHDKGTDSVMQLWMFTMYSRYFGEAATNIAIMETVRDSYYKMMKGLSNGGVSGGTYYLCMGKDGPCSKGWNAYHKGWWIGLCHPFFHESGRYGRAQTLIHELSHQYAGTDDHDYIYMTQISMGMPEYQQKKDNVWNPAQLVYRKRLNHADTLAYFAMLWYRE